MEGAGWKGALPGGWALWEEDEEEGPPRTEGDCGCGMTVEEGVGGVRW